MNQHTADLIFLNSFLLPFLLLSLKAWTAFQKYFLKLLRKLLEVGSCILLKDSFSIPWRWEQTNFLTEIASCLVIH